MKDRVQQPHVPVRSAARTDVTQDLRILAREMAGAERRDGAGAHVGDVGSVDDRHRAERLDVGVVEVMDVYGSISAAFIASTRISSVSRAL